MAMKTLKKTKEEIEQDLAWADAGARPKVSEEELAEEELPITGAAAPIVSPWLTAPDSRQGPYNPDMPYRREMVNPYAPGMRPVDEPWAKRNEEGVYQGLASKIEGNVQSQLKPSAMPRFQEGDDFVGQNMNPLAASIKDPSMINFHRMRSAMFAGKPSNPARKEDEEGFRQSREGAIAGAMNMVAAGINEKANREQAAKEIELRDATQRFLGTQKTQESPAEMEAKIYYQAINSGRPPMDARREAKEFVAAHMQQTGDSNLPPPPIPPAPDTPSGKRLAEEQSVVEQRTKVASDNPIIDKFVREMGMAKNSDDLYDKLVAYSQAKGELAPGDVEALANYFSPKGGADAIVRRVYDLQQRSPLGRKTPDWLYNAPGAIAEKASNWRTSPLFNPGKIFGE